jgi:hypothetical protein
MVIGRLLKLSGTLVHAAALVAVVFVLAGLLGFLTDAVSGSSKVSTTRIERLSDRTVRSVTTVDISQPNPPAAVERLRTQKHKPAREFIDDVGDVLMSPFTGIAEASRPWVQRLLDSGLALLLYGLVAWILGDRLRRIGDGRRRHAFSAAEEKAAAARRESGTYLSPA